MKTHVCDEQDKYDEKFSNDLGFDLTCYPSDLTITLGIYHLERTWWAQLYEYSIPIKYCPFCGEKLNDEKN